MSSQPLSVFTNVEDFSSNKPNLCYGCCMISAIKVVANIWMLLCIISWHFHWQSWDTELKNGTQRTLNSRLVPIPGGCILSGFAQESIIIQYSQKLFKWWTRIATGSMTNIVCKSITTQDHHLKPWSKDLERWFSRDKHKCLSTAGKINYPHLEW